MRVIAGEVKGYSLKCPKTPKIRPTADKVREAIFSALESRDIDWDRVLDLYAGSGALGIEALSRGAQAADFVEKNHLCCRTITDNLTLTGFRDIGNIYCQDTLNAMDTLDKQYSIIFLDPPYFSKEYPIIMTRIASSSLVHSRSTIVFEHSSRFRPESSYAAFQMVNMLFHGDTTVSMYQCTGGMN